MMKIGMLTLSIFFLSVVLSQSTRASQQESVLSDPVTITQVEVRLSDHGPVVLLQAEGKAIPIFVDMTVAVSIQGALKGEKLPRPLSHDLMHAILQTFGGKVTQAGTILTLIVTIRRLNWTVF